MEKVNDEGRMQMEVCLTGEESINFVKSKFTDKIIAGYKLFGTALIITSIFFIILVVSFIKSHEVIYLVMLILMIMPFAIIIQEGKILIQNLKKQSQDYEEGIVLLKQANLKRVNIEDDKHLKFCFTDNNGIGNTYRVLTCFQYKYSEKLELNEIQVDCRKCIVYISGLYMLNKTV